MVNTNQNRRSFISNAAVSLAAVQLGMLGIANAKPEKEAHAASTIHKPEGNSSFDPLKQIDAGLLNVGYAEAGPANGPVVLLLHGWPYDIYSFADVAPLLAASGYRVIIPYGRGYGATRFLSNETMRNGQPLAMALDVIALMDALKIKKAVIGGFDWGTRTANIIAALWPERCKAFTAVKTIDENERDYIITMLKKCGWKIYGPGGATELMNINASTLKSRMNKLGIEKEKNIDAAWLQITGIGNSERDGMVL
jgi:hypothetical protein